MNALLELKSRFKNQDEMAKALGVTQGAVSQWLTGYKKPSVRTCKLIEEKFGIPRKQIRPDIYA